MTTRERRIARADRLRGWAEKRAAKSAAAFDQARTITAGIPMGQPILVGHHSERRHRRDLARHDGAMRRGVDSERMAASMESRADNIEAAAEAAIYRDDVDVIERLTEKIAGLEARREQMKTANAAFRKSHKAALKAEPSAYQRGQMMPHMAYELQNLGGNISRERARLAVLTAAKTSSGAAIVAATAGTPAERAGLTVTAGMTTPSRPGKKPRPVWTVSGNLAFWRPLLVDKLGGSWYRGAVSFWDDPTDAIDEAVRDAEQRDADRGFPFEVS